MCVCCTLLVVSSNGTQTERGDKFLFQKTEAAQRDGGDTINLLYMKQTKKGLQYCKNICSQSTFQTQRPSGKLSPDREEVSVVSSTQTEQSLLVVSFSVLLNDTNIIINNNDIKYNYYVQCQCPV